MMTYKFTFILLSTALLLNNPVNAYEYQSHKEILSTAQAFISNALASEPDKVISIQPMDNRLNLKQCNEDLYAFFPTGARRSGKTTIGIECRDNKPWKLYVSASITIYASIIVANEHIDRGTYITSAQLIRVRKNISTISRGYFTSMEQVVGKIAKNQINRDRIIHPASIRRPKLVKRGKEVVIQASTGEIIVKMRGIAISDGALGDLISIKNKRSKRIIQGQVIGSNLVEATM